MRIGFGLMALVFFIISCQKGEEGIVQTEPLKASFDITVADSNNIFENQTIRFNNQSTGYVRCRWELGNKIQSTQVSPVHQYAMHGYYSVRLTVWNTAGESATCSRDLPILCNFSSGGSTH